MKELTEEQASRLIRAYQAVFNTQMGAEVLADLAHLCHANATTFDPSNPDALKLAHNEGKRRIWIHIQAMLTLSATEVSKLTQQEQEDE